MLYEDVPEAIGEILLKQWSLPIGEEPTITFNRNAYFQESRVGAIFIYQTNRTNSISTTDYRTQIPKVIEAVASGALAEDTIDTACRRVLTWKQELGMIGR